MVDSAYKAAYDWRGGGPQPAADKLTSPGFILSLMTTAAPHRGSRPAQLGRDYGLPLLFFFALAALLSWPTVAHLTTAITSDGGEDARLNIWTLWHAGQAFTFREPLLYARDLYFPIGVSLLTHSPGPLMGLLAAPFWWLGPTATYNLALMLGLALTGFCMYLLGRGVGFGRGVAVFSGLVLMTAPMVVGGLLQHMDKVFLGLVPLALLMTLYALDPRRSRWWAVGPGVVLLLTMLQGGWHFITAGLGVGLLMLMLLAQAGRAARRLVLGRAALAVVGVALLVGPMLVATGVASDNVGVQIDRTGQSVDFQPDVTQFFRDRPYNRLGQMDRDVLAASGYRINIETAVFMAWTGLALAVLGLATSWRRAWPWAVLLLAGVLLALGPNLRVAGRDTFTAFNRPIALPYAFFTELPGMAFMRTPGRFMFLGFTAFAVLAGFGLAWLTLRFPRAALPLVGLACAVLLVEMWPQPWPSETLRDVPAFYQQIASDPEMYGVFDLPHRLRSNDLGIAYSSHYQYYQLFHHKGIAAGYVSFAYDQHPVFPCFYSEDATPPDLLVDGKKVSCYANAPYQLSQAGYRYLVQHKPQRVYSNYKPGSVGDRIAQDFAAQGFAGQAPVVDDDLTTVYSVPREIDPATLKTTIEFREGWDAREETQRWARSPAILYAISPVARPATLRITPAALHAPAAANGVGESGRLTVTANGESHTVDMRVDQPVDVPITLQPGSQTISIALETGNFRPTDYGTPDPRTLSFAIRSIDLLTEGR